jgi:hypothetical protein
MPFGFERLALVPMGWGIDATIWVARARGNHAAFLSRYPAVAASPAGRERLPVRGPNLAIEARTFHAGTGPPHMQLDM